MPEADPAIWRQDACGAWMRREQYREEHSEFGWKIEKISAGGRDTAENLRPFHCSNRYDIEMRAPHCRTTSDRRDVPAVEYIYPPRNRSL
jgi:hypothetical protein